MERFIWNFVAVFLFVSCYEISDKPIDLLDKSKVSEVLYQIYLHKNYMIVKENNSIVKNIEIKKMVLKEMKTSEKVFDLSMDYYVLHPKEYHQILESVKNRFESQQELEPEILIDNE